MTQEQKDLLLKDLCARLPYGVNCEIYHKYKYYDMKLSGVFGDEAYLTDDNGSLYIDYENVRPYLFPLSSMTEEQKIDLTKCLDANVFVKDEISFWSLFAANMMDKWKMIFEWCDKNHFDYRGLIPMGLANNATGLNIY